MPRVIARGGLSRTRGSSRGHHATVARWWYDTVQVGTGVRHLERALQGRDRHRWNVHRPRHRIGAGRPAAHREGPLHTGTSVRGGAGGGAQNRAAARDRLLRARYHRRNECAVATWRGAHFLCHDGRLRGRPVHPADQPSRPVRSPVGEAPPIRQTRRLPGRPRACGSRRICRECRSQTRRSLA